MQILDALPVKNKFIFLFATAGVLVGMASFFVYYQSTKKEVNITKIPLVIKQDFNKIEFSSTTKSSLLQEILVPTETIFSQSYQLQYPTKTQSTVVFSSLNTAQENYVMYEKFLTQKEWWLPERYKHKGETFFSLYAQKGEFDINITINELHQSTTTKKTSKDKLKSEISITLLKR